MRSQLHRVLVSTGLAAATLLGTASSSFAQVRDHRHDPPPQAESGPREAPPTPREERHDARREGFVWVGGRWEWRRREHKWDWLPGRWEREKHGHKWREARWEQHGDEWVLVDGGWIQAEVRPTQAPPAQREERFEARPGFVWVRGRWDWRDGNWVWVDGRYERERAGKRWRESRWEFRDGAYVLVDGDWIDAPISRFPTAAPPAPRDERPAVRAGFVWVRGRWDWRNGNWEWLPGRWERERAAQRWNEGRWELRGDHWEWIEGGWGEVPKYPPLDQPPPPPQRDDIRVDPGFVVIPGRWTWENGQYVSQHGQRAHAEPGMHYVSGEWVQRDGHWLWTNGNWVKDEAPPPPPRYNPPPGGGPTSAPPPPREERISPRDGFVWARGHQEWRGNQYEWIPGHWERQRAQLTWYDGRWEQRGNAWIYIEGGWR